MFRKYSLVLIFLVSCEVQESKNIYTPPNNTENIQINLQLQNYSQEKIKTIESNIASIFNLENMELSSDFTLDIKIQDIPKYIDCGQMNDEIYVEYIERIFGSSLKATIKIDLTKDGDLYKFNKMLINYLLCLKKQEQDGNLKQILPKNS